MIRSSLTLKYDINFRKDFVFSYNLNKGNSFNFLYDLCVANDRSFSYDINVETSLEFSYNLICIPQTFTFVYYVKPNTNDLVFIYNIYKKEDLSFSYDIIESAIEFVCSVGLDPDQRDYLKLSLWNDAVACDLTSVATQVFSITSTSIIPDGARLRLYHNSLPTNYYSTLVHMTQTQVLFKDLSSGTPQVGDKFVQTTTGHYLTLTSLGHKAIAVAECYNDFDVPVHDDVTMDGWTTDRTCYVKLVVPTEERHSGYAESGYRMYTCIQQNLFTISSLDIHMNGFEFYGGTEQVEYVDRDSTIHAIKFENCIFHDNSFGDMIDFKNAKNSLLEIRNCIFYNGDKLAIYGHSTSLVSVQCTSVFNTDGIWHVDCWDVIAHQGYSANLCFVNCTGDYNCDGAEFYDDDSAPGNNSLHSQKIEDLCWVNTESRTEDLRIYPASVLVGEGIVSLFSPTGYSMDNYDIAGYLRADPWTMGAADVSRSSSSSSSSSSRSSVSSSSSKSKQFLMAREMY